MLFRGLWDKDRDRGSNLNNSQRSLSCGSAGEVGLRAPNAIRPRTATSVSSVEEHRGGNRGVANMHASRWRRPHQTTKPLERRIEQTLTNKHTNEQASKHNWVGGKANKHDALHSYCYCYLHALSPTKTKALKRNERLRKQTNERKNERTNERTNERRPPNNDDDDDDDGDDNNNNDDDDDDDDNEERRQRRRRQRSSE